MASKYELTISTDYVPEWGIVEAVRELFQNALDNEIMNPENKMYFEYDETTYRLLIGNKTSMLTLDSLLLGKSTKRNNDETIGQHGEGYKIALMVLLRENKGITIFNSKAGEVWSTRLTKSKRYNGAMVPTVTVEHKSFFTRVKDHDLVIEVTNVSKEEYQMIKNSNLHICGVDNIEKIDCDDLGSILLDDSYKGKVFVNGLYVCTNDKLSYGYNIMPKYVELDRDRRLIADFNLSWTSSRMWKMSDSELLPKLVFDGAFDVKYIKDAYTHNYSDNYRLEETIYEEFKNNYGTESIAVSNQEQFLEALKLVPNEKIVMVEKEVVEIIKDKQKELHGFEDKKPKDKLVDWFNTIEHKLDSEEIETFYNILNKL